VTQPVLCFDAEHAEWKHISINIRHLAVSKWQRVETLFYNFEMQDASG